MKYKYITLLALLFSSLVLSAQVQTQTERLNLNDNKTIKIISPDENQQSCDTCDQDQQQEKNQRQNTRNEQTVTREQIMNNKIAFFTAELGLTLEEAQVFWPVYNAYWDAINKSHRETRNLLKELSRVDKDGKSDSATIAKKLQQYVDSYEKEGKIFKEYYDKFLTVLSPEKVVKLYLAEERFRDKMIEMIKEQPKKN